MLTTTTTTAVFFVLVFAAVASAAPPRPVIPKEYHFSFSRMDIFTRGGQVVNFTDGTFALSNSLQATFQGGLVVGVNMSTLDLFAQKLSFTWLSIGGCQKSAMPATFDDPLMSVQYMSYEGPVELWGLKAQLWTFLYESTVAHFYVTDNAFQLPMRFDLDNGGSGMEISFKIFSEGFDLSDYLPPRACWSR